MPHAAVLPHCSPAIRSGILRMPLPWCPPVAPVLASSFPPEPPPWRSLTASRRPLGAVLRVLHTPYPEVEKPRHAVPTWGGRPRKGVSPPQPVGLRVGRYKPSRALSSETPTTGAPYVQRAATGRRVAFCRRAGTLFAMGCANGHNCCKWVPCGMLDCETCAEGAGRVDRMGRASGIVGRRRGNRLYERFGGPGLARLVCTLPGARDLSEAQVHRARSLFHDAIHSWARAVWGVEVGLHSFLHPEGDKSRGVWQPHFHFQMPLFGATVADGQISGMGPLVGLVPKQALKRLRALMLQVYQALGISGKANVYYKFHPAEDTVKKLHGISYDGRSFPPWYAGNLARSLRIGRSTGLLAPRCGLAGIDAWRDAVRGPPPELSEPTDSEERVRMGLDCPCCGSPLAILDVIKMDRYRLEIHGQIVDVYGEHPGSLEVAACYEATGPPIPLPHERDGPPVWSSLGSPEDIPY